MRMEKHTGREWTDAALAWSSESLLPELDEVEGDSLEDVPKAVL